MNDVDYDAWKTRCSADFDSDCVKYFLALPRGDLYAGKQTRSDFASDYCRDQSRMGEVPCDVLCRDNSGSCLETRQEYCKNVTLEDIIRGDKPECACYLPVGEYKRHIESLRDTIGSVAYDQLLHSIQAPQCYYAPCARSIPGLATRHDGCRAITGCLQSITIDKETQQHTIRTNVCNIRHTERGSEGGTEGGGGGGTGGGGESGGGTGGGNTLPPPGSNWGWMWWLLGGLFLLLALVVILILVLRRPKTNSNDALMLYALSRSRMRS